MGRMKENGRKMKRNNENCQKCMQNREKIMVEKYV
jgi:hypothetical protein